MANDSTNSVRSSVMSDAFIVLFPFFSASEGLSAKVIPIGYLQSDPRLHNLHVLALTCPLVEYFASHTPNFHLIRAVCFLLRL